MVCFYKWCVFTNGVLLQIVWMSVWLCCADTLGPAYPMLVSPGQKLRADASGNHSKYSVSHVTHVSFSIRVRIIRIFSGYSHLHSYVLSGIVESFRKSSIFQLSMKGSFENDLVLNRPFFGELSQGIFTKSWATYGWTVLYVTWQTNWQSRTETPPAKFLLRYSE